MLRSASFRFRAGQIRLARMRVAQIRVAKVRFAQGRALLEVTPFLAAPCSNSYP
jgi:hypothetical protein